MAPIALCIGLEQNTYPEMELSYRGEQPETWIYEPLLDTQDMYHQAQHIIQLAQQHGTTILVVPRNKRLLLALYLMIDLDRAMEVENGSYKVFVPRYGMVPTHKINPGQPYFAGYDRFWGVHMEAFAIGRHSYGHSKPVQF